MASVLTRWVPLVLTVACVSTPARPPLGTEPAPAPAVVLATGAASLPIPAPVPPQAGLTTAPPKPRCGLPESLLGRGWPRQLAPVASEPPFLPTPGSTTFAIIPDTQYYALCRSPHLAAQLDWVQSQGALGNIRAAFTLGDLTESNTPEEWRFVQERFRSLRAQMPVTMATGNHDYGDSGSADRRHTLFQDYFSDLPQPSREVLVETQRPFDLENAYYRIDLGKVTLGVLVLEWTPRTAAVAWANAVLARHLEDRVIFITHAYLYHDSTRYDWWAKGEEQEWNPMAYGTARLDPAEPATPGNVHPEGAYDGEMLWKALVSRHRGIFLTLNGHVLDDGAGLLSSRGRHGNLVHQVLVNYQMLDEGGLGYLRLLELLPDGKNLRMSTYSPSLDRYATQADQTLELPITPSLW